MVFIFTLLIAGTGFGAVCFDNIIWYHMESESGPQGSSLYLDENGALVWMVNDDTDTEIVGIFREAIDLSNSGDAAEVEWQWSSDGMRNSDGSPDKGLDGELCPQFDWDPATSHIDSQVDDFGCEYLYAANKYYDQLNDPNGDPDCYENEYGLTTLQENYCPDFRSDVRCISMTGDFRMALMDSSEGDYIYDDPYGFRNEAFCSYLGYQWRFHPHICSDSARRDPVCFASENMTTSAWWRDNPDGGPTEDGLTSGHTLTVDAGGDKTFNDRIYGPAESCFGLPPGEWTPEDKPLRMRITRDPNGNNMDEIKWEFWFMDDYHSVKNSGSSNQPQKIDSIAIGYPNLRRYKYLKLKTAAVKNIITEDAESVKACSAKLNATVNMCDLRPADVTFWWGTSDGQDSSQGWEVGTEGIDYGRLELHGQDTGPVSAVLSNLAPNTTYYYRCRLTTVYEDLWSDTTRSFTTTSDTTVDVLDNMVEVSVNSSIRIPVLDNDTGCNLYLDNVTSAAHGTAVIDGYDIVYTPDSGFKGNDSFSYTATGEGVSDTAGVYVTVHCDNVPPNGDIYDAKGYIVDFRDYALVGRAWESCFDADDIIKLTSNWLGWPWQPDYSIDITGLNVNDGQPWQVQDDLQEGDLMYTDREFTFSFIPESLKGSKWIQTSNNSKSSNDFPLAVFYVSKDADVYVAVDNRAPVPSWLADSSYWEDTGQELYNDDSSEGFSIYTGVRSSLAVLGPCDQGVSSQSMYTVIVRPKGL